MCKKIGFVVLVLFISCCTHGQVRIDSSYSNGTLTEKQTMLDTTYRGKSIKVELDLTKGLLRTFINDKKDSMGLMVDDNTKFGGNSLWVVSKSDTVDLRQLTNHYFKDDLLYVTTEDWSNLKFVYIINCSSGKIIGYEGGPLPTYLDLFIIGNNQILCSDQPDVFKGDIAYKIYGISNDRITLRKQWKEKLSNRFYSDQQAMLALLNKLSKHLK